MPADHIHHLRCVLCGARYDPAEVTYTCPACGPLGVLEVHYDYERIARHISRAQLVCRATSLSLIMRRVPRSCNCSCAVRASLLCRAATMMHLISALRHVMSLVGTTVIRATILILLKARRLLV